MSHLVETTHGLIARERLETKDVVTEGETSRITATEWYLAGELVRRDVWVSALQGLKIGAESGS